VNIAGVKVSVAAIVAAVGGLAAIVAAPLTWATAKFGGESTNLGGLDEGINSGRIEIVLGIVALVLVAAWVMKVKVPAVAGIPTIPALVVLVGVLILVVVVSTYFNNWFVETSLKDSADAAKAVGGEVSLGIGFFLAAAAGIVAVVGGLIPIVRKGA
jgi:hypothetical protein